MAGGFLHTSANGRTPVALDQATIEWIEAALAATPHGEVILTVQDHRVMGVDVRGRRRVPKPRQEEQGEDTCNRASSSV